LENIEINKIEKFILFLAILTPAMPKLQFVDGITIYLLEIVLLLYFPIGWKNIRLKYQKTLLAIWLIMLLSTIYSQLYCLDIGGILRCIKGLLYIPLGYIMCKYVLNNRPNIRIVFYVFILATICNVLNLLYNGLDLANMGTLVWDNKLIGAGLSNRFWDIKTMSLGTIPGGAHGIWGNYCVLVFTVCLCCRVKHEINFSLFLVVTFCLLLNSALSVSRESLISLLFTLLALLYTGTHIHGLKIKVHRFVLYSAIVLLTVFFLLIYYFADYFQVINKVLYTFKAIEESGEESNIMLRVNAWKVYFESLSLFPSKILTGYGFNLDNYNSYLDFAYRAYKDAFVPLPESFFVQLFCFGGIFCLIKGLKLWREIFFILKSIKLRMERNIYLGYFVGFLIVNMFSGASLLSDMLYCQMILFWGYLLACQKINN
jgi:O-antigen ligase